jgi:hypothetical protein
VTWHKLTSAITKSPNLTVSSNYFKAREREREREPSKEPGEADGKQAEHLSICSAEYNEAWSHSSTPSLFLSSKNSYGTRYYVFMDLPLWVVKDVSQLQLAPSPACSPTLTIVTWRLKGEIAERERRPLLGNDSTNTSIAREREPKHIDPTASQLTTAEEPWIRRFPCDPCRGFIRSQLLSLQSPSGAHNSGYGEWHPRGTRATQCLGV